MELHFTGIGAAYYPQLGSNAAFFVYHDHLFMIDCGESTFARMACRKEIYQYDKITIFITHLHADHIGSLGSFASYCKNELGKMVTIVAQDDTVVEILRLTGVPANMYHFTTDFEQCFEESLQIKPVRVQHATDMACCGFLIHDESGTVYFSADACAIPEDILLDFKSGLINTMYHDCTFFDKDSTSHCSLKKLCEYIPESERKRVYCMHFGGPFLDEVKAKGFHTVSNV